MKVAKVYKKYCDQCHRAQLVGYTHDDKYANLYCSVCKKLHSSTSADIIEERLVRLLNEPMEDE